MKLEVFTVFDKAVKAFLQPFFCRSRGEALRSFGDSCNDDKSLFYRHASDYELVYLGEYDDASATFETVSPQRVISALECKLPDPFPEEKRRSNGPGSAGHNLPM